MVVCVCVCVCVICKQIIIILTAAGDNPFIHVTNHTSLYPYTNMYMYAINVHM